MLRWENPVYPFFKFLWIGPGRAVYEPVGCIRMGSKPFRLFNKLTNGDADIIPIANEQTKCLGLSSVPFRTILGIFGSITKYEWPRGQSHLDRTQSF